MADHKAPYVPKELVVWLERVFPDKCPDPSTPERLIWTSTGNVEVVRKLRQMLDQQKE